MKTAMNHSRFIFLATVLVFAWGGMAEAQTGDTHEVIANFNMDTDPGWSTEGQWGYGHPQGAGGDPSSGYTGSNVYGYNLAGKYPNGMSKYWLTTTPIDCSGYTNVVLSFQRWLGIESSSFDHAYIQISNDGSTWQQIWANPGSVNDGSWKEVSYDISSVADGQAAVYIRWGMGPSDGSVTYCGWNIDDVEISGVSAFDVELSLNLPDVVNEGAGTMPGAGQLVVSSAQSNDLVVVLSVDEDRGLSVPEQLTIPAGQTNVYFDLTVLDDALLNGSRDVWIEASAEGCKPGGYSVAVRDNETAALTLLLPNTTYEGIGLLEGALQVDTPPDADIVVELRSGDTNEISSSTVVIPAGQTAVPVELDVVDDEVLDGVKTVMVEAHVENWTDGECHVFVFDNEQATDAPPSPPSGNNGQGSEAFKLTEVGQLTGMAGMTKIEYCPERDLLFLMSGNDVRVVRGTSGEVLGTRVATETFTDMDLTRDGRYLFVADYGGERTGYGTPINPHYVHRYDLVNNIWQSAQAPKIAWKIEAVASDRVLLQEHDQWIDITLNSFGATIAELSRIGADYYGDMEYDPDTGRVYHGNSGLSSREIAVRTVSGDTLVNSGDTGVYGTAQNGGGTSVLSTDGAYFFYGRLQVDAMNVRSNIRYLPESIYAASSRLAFGKGSYYSVDTGEVLGSWSFSSGTLGVSEDGIHVWAYESASSTLHHYIDALVTHVVVPVDAREADGLLSMSGSVSVAVAPVSNLVINLSSSNPNEVEVPASVTLLAGETNAAFDIVVLDDTLFDGSQPVAISADPNQQNYTGSEGVIVVHDNESATLSLSLPPSTIEGSGGISGMVNVNPVADRDVVVDLVSDNPHKISGGRAVIKAGDESAAFTLAVLDDNLIDHLQTATIEARVENWESAKASIFIADNETADIRLALPSSVMEGDGVVTNAGEVMLSGTLLSDVNIMLRSSDTSEVTVPFYVTIPAGQSNAFFDITAVDDGVVDGKQFPVITASAPGFITGSESMPISDNEFHHFSIVGFAGEDPGYIPVPCSVHAVNIDDEYVDTYSGPAWLSGALGSDPVAVDPSGAIMLTNGLWQGEVTFHGVGEGALIFTDDHEGHVGTNEVSLAGFNIVKMATDWDLPYIYMVHRYKSSPYKSALIWYNTDSGSIEHAVSAGENVTDITVSYGDNRIYACNAGRSVVSAFDRTLKAELPPLSIGSYARVIAGRPGLLFVENGSTLRAYDTTDESQVASARLGYNTGDGDCSLDGTQYYHCDNGTSGSRLYRIDVSADTYAIQTSIRTANYYGSDRVFVSMDGKRVYNCKHVYDADLNVLLNIGSEIYAASAYGDIVLTATKAYNGVNGDEVYTLPFTSTVMAFSGDQSSLVLFNGSDGTLTNLSTSDIMPLPEPAVIPEPANGEVVGANLPRLVWSSAPTAIAYDIYLGTDSNAVAFATTNDVQYLGRRTTTDFALAEGVLTGNQTYYWRVDIVGFGNAVVDGDVWNFQTASIEVDPYELSVAGMAADYSQMVSVAVNSTVGTPVAWTASCTNDWVQLGASSGTASGSLDIGFDMSRLAAGSYTADIIFNDGSSSLVVPVTLEVETMRIVKMATDWTMPYIYMVHTSSTVPNKSRLIWYNADSGTIEKVLDAGENATDLTVHYGDNRIYVSNWQRAETRVFDRSAKVELGPLLLGNDVFKINAGRAGVLITEEEDQWIDVRIRDTATGSTLATRSESEGDGDCTLDGRYYYHTDNNSSGARLSRFTITNGTFAGEISVRTENYYGSRNVFVSMDGNRVYNCKHVYDADLNVLLNIGSEIYAASAYGDMVLTATKAYNGVNGDEVYTLPFTSTVMAFSGDQSSLVLFNGSDGTLTNLKTSDIMPVPEPKMLPAPADGTVVGVNLPELAWPGAPAVIAYDIYLGADSNAVASATTNDVQYMGRQTTPDFALAEGVLTGNQTYYWRVDIVGFGNAVVGGDIWSFRTASITADPHELNIAGVATAYTQTVHVAVNSAFGNSVGWTAFCSNDWVQLDAASGMAPGTLDIGFDMSRLAAGTYTADIVFNAGSESLALPVRLEVFPLNITKMEADASKPWLYALNVVQTGTKPSQLVVINIGTEKIEQVVPVVDNARDFAVHYGDDRLYVAAFGDANVSVVDRSTAQRLADVALNTQVYRISSGPAGRLVTDDDGSGNAYYGRMRVWDSQQGTLFQTTAQYTTGRGTGESDATGQYYYRGDGTVYPYTGMIRKYDLSSGSLVQVKSVGAPKSSRRELVLSGDGSRVFWTGRVYDSDLNIVTNLGVEVYAASSDGSMVATMDSVLDANLGYEIAALPAASPALAFVANDTGLAYFNPDTKAIEWLALSPTGPVAASNAYLLWSKAYFASEMLAPDAMADSDGDGLCNMEEYIAGTDPTSADSYFAVHDAAAPTNGQFVIYWDAVTGRVYSVYWKPALTNAYEPMETNIYYPQASYTDTVHQAEGQGFYKVGVDLQ